MRAKRSKKYRKTMSAYQLAFSFREPYQVLLDAAFLRTCHAFHMPLQKYLENTLHGQCRMFVTQCTLEKIMNEQEKATGRRRRPDFLPAPTELPLRYCKHKNDEGEELGVLSEHHCLLDLLAGQPKGNEVPKNKQHYVLASADAEENEQRRKVFAAVRERARMIPGVPIVYVKRSVMILEDMSRTSELSKRGQEKDKFRESLLGDRKRKRDENEEGEVRELMDDDQTDGHKRGLKKPKEPNPLSVRKKKAKASPDEVEGQDSTSKRRRGKRGKKKSAEDGQDIGIVDEGDAVGIDES